MGLSSRRKSAQFLMHEMKKVGYKTTSRKPSWWELNKFILITLRPKDGFIFGTSVVGIICSLVGAFSHFPQHVTIFSSVQLLLWIFMLTVSIYSCFQRVRDETEDKLVPDAEFLKELISIEPDPSLIRHGYKSAIVPSREEPVIRSAEVDKILRGKNVIRLKCDQSGWSRVRSELRRQAPELERILRCEFVRCLKDGKQFSNKKKICFSTDLTPGIPELPIYQSCYFASFLLGEACTMDLTTRGSSSGYSLKGRDRFPRVNNNGRSYLKAIAEQSLSQHVGANTIGHTKDGKIILWTQNEYARFSEGFLAPPGSGSCDWDDLDVDMSLRGTVVNAMERKFEEESNSIGHTIRGEQILETEVIGLFIWVTRVGKPGFLGVSKLGVSSYELSPNKAEVRVGKGHFKCYPAGNMEEMNRTIKDLLLKVNLSVPLWANLVCLQEAIAEDSDRWQKFFFGQASPV